MILVRCPRCGIEIGKVKGQVKGNDDPNWPTKPPNHIRLMCPDCVEAGALEAEYTPEQAKNARTRREQQLHNMTWEEGGPR
jgi:sarcosine oxidase delta subunit